MSQNVFFVAVCKKEKSRAIILGSSTYQKADVDVSGVKQLLESQHNLETGKHYSFIPGEIAWHLIQGMNVLICLLCYPF